LLEITSLKEEQIEDAAVLVSRRYARLREQLPLLPQRYTEIPVLASLLGNILPASEFGVAAFQGPRLVGFLTSWLMPSFRGKRSVYSPEWANGAEPGDSQRIYEEMYSRIAADWVAERYVAHYISLFPDDPEALRTWKWLGFGLVTIDALRGVDPIQGDFPQVQIRRAGMQDIEQVMELDAALWLHTRSSPDFLVQERKDRGYYEAWLQDPENVFWLADRSGEPAAFMSLGPANDDVCTIIVDEKTTSIYGAFTKEGVRGQGIATALLEHALKWAREAGYERCAVDFEPMNIIGARFWLRYFKPVCVSLFRQINEILTSK